MTPPLKSMVTQQWTELLFIRHNKTTILHQTKIHYYKPTLSHIAKSVPNSCDRIRNRDDNLEPQRIDHRGRHRVWEASYCIVVEGFNRTTMDVKPLAVVAVINK